MKCPVCGVWSFVRETRTRLDNSKYRAYECANEHRFRTSERVEAVKQGTQYRKYVSLVQGETHENDSPR